MLKEKENKFNLREIIPMTAYPRVVGSVYWIDDGGLANTVIVSYYPDVLPSWNEVTIHLQIEINSFKSPFPVIQNEKEAVVYFFPSSLEFNFFHRFITISYHVEK